MPFNPNIPRTPEEVTNAARLLVRTVGLQNLEVKIWDGTIPSQDERNVIPIPPQSSIKNKIGNIAVSNLIIKSKDYFDIDGNLVTSFNEDVIIDTVLFDVSRQKNIVTTDIQGRDEPVIEYIAGGSKTINMKCLLSGRNGEYPIDQMANLLQAVNASVELEVQSWFLDQFGIKTIVFTGDMYPTNEGSISYQIVELQAISTTPVELKLSK